MCYLHFWMQKLLVYLVMTSIDIQSLKNEIVALFV